MSAGSKIIQLRLPDEILKGVLLAIAESNERRREAPYDMSSWIRAAIQEKLDHRQRSRRKRNRNVSEELGQAEDIGEQAE